MALMIPPVPNPACSSAGERYLFARLKECPGTADWIVLHSLDLADHHRRLSGEIDFAVIVPGKGVLCLEVKGCTKLRRESGLWYYGDSNTGDPRGPFKQAADAMHSLRRRLADRRSDLRSVLFWSGVVFPYLDFSISSPEWHPWQVIDSGKLRRQPVGRAVLDMLEAARLHVATKQSAWFHDGLFTPAPQQCRAMAATLRGDFECYESPRARSLRSSAELKRYTEEQYVALDAMEGNPRVLFTGPAGTGKTLLAIEAARRAALNDRRVLLVCFNRLLGQWLASQTETLGPQVHCSTLHSYLKAVASSADSSGEGDTYWQVELPEAAAAALLRGDWPTEAYDELILDEAQDIICRDPYLDCLDLSVIGGLASGKWRLFGDFERQTIYAIADSHPMDVLRHRVGDVPLFDLRVNCRNSPRIAAVTRLLGGLDPDYTRVRRPDDGVEPELYYYRSTEEQLTKLVEVLEKLWEEGFAGEDIAVLSPRGDQYSAASLVSGSPWRDRLRSMRDGLAGHVGYTTIHAFKGLERSAIIVTDIEHLDTNDAEQLLYIAITRALDRLYILANASTKASVIAMLRRNKVATSTQREEQ